MEYPKSFLIALLVLASGCGTTHKVSHSEKKTSDSTVTVVRDTARVTHETTKTHNFNAQDIHIRVEYPADTALAKAKEQRTDTVDWKPYYPKSKSKAGQIAQAISDAISASGSAGRLPSSVTIDIGSISDSSTRTSKNDSGGVHAATSTDLIKTDNRTSEETTHTGLSVGYKIGLGIFVFIILLVAAWRLYKRFKP